LTDRRTITLTTDFGSTDTWVGQIKGAILAVDPSIAIVDLCHEVPPHDVRAGAWQLEVGHGAFPPGTIHLAVVDPGVGTARRAVAVETARYVFVGPDNGLLARALAHEIPLRAHLLTDPQYVSAAPSPTFHGRDVFAPAAAWIARGVPLDALGPPAGALAPLDRTVPAIARGACSEVAVVAIDRFGNVVLDLRAEEIERALGRDWRDRVEIEIAGRPPLCFARTYGEAPADATFFLVGSAGYLEIARREASAARATALAAGDQVAVRFR
jgi:S-adenosylmethionine hydrolase